MPELRDFGSALTYPFARQWKRALEYVNRSNDRLVNNVLTSSKSRCLLRRAESFKIGSDQVDIIPGSSLFLPLKHRASGHVRGIPRYDRTLTLFHAWTEWSMKVSRQHVGDARPEASDTVEG